MRSGKPKRFPECKEENLLKVVLGTPDNVLWDNVENTILEVVVYHHFKK